MSPDEAREPRGTGPRDAQADDTPVLGVVGSTLVVTEMAGYQLLPTSSSR